MAEKKKKTLIGNIKKLFSDQANQISTANDAGMMALTNALALLANNLETLEEVSKSKLVKTLPPDRLSQYPEFDLMEEDSICGAALNIHVNNALTYDEEAGYSIQIESKTNERDPIVADIRTTFHEWLQENAKNLAYNILKNGCWGVRPYVNKHDNGLDLQKTLIAEGHPRSFKIFNSLGAYVGVWSEYQDPNKLPQLSKPWQFIVFKTPNYGVKSHYRPRRVHPTDPSYQFDIWDNDPPATLCETVDYGKSFFHRAYTPWKNLDEACLALLVARMKASQRETLIGFPVGNQDPLEAAAAVTELTDMMQARDDEDSKRSLKENLVRIAKKIVIPFDASGKGQLSFAQTDPNINIEGINDLLLFVRIECGALSIEPSLVGFSDLMSGGLGEGGFLRNSINAATIGISLRQALRNGIDRAIEMHVMLRHGKIYVPENKPWRIKFKAVSDAKEREANDVRMGNMDFVERLTNWMIAIEEQEGSPKIPRDRFKNFCMSNILKIDEPILKELLRPALPEQALEKGEKFKDMKVEEKVQFLDYVIDNYMEEQYVA